MLLVRAYSKNTGQRSIFARKGTFYEKGELFMKKGHFFEKRALFLKKGHQNFHPSYSIPFLSVLHHNKALYNFRKRGQHSIVERNIGLESALLVVSNAHISTTLSHPL